MWWGRNGGFQTGLNLLRSCPPTPRFVSWLELLSRLQQDRCGEHSPKAGLAGTWNGSGSVFGVGRLAWFFGTVKTTYVRPATNLRFNFLTRMATNASFSLGIEYHWNGQRACPCLSTRWRFSSLVMCLLIVRLLLLKCSDNCCDVARFSLRRYARIVQSKT